LSFFPILNLLVVGIAKEVETLFVTRRAGFDSTQGSRSAKRYAKATTIAETAFLIVLSFLFGGYGGGGTPSPLVYLPEWVSWMFWSLPVGILTLGVLYAAISIRMQQIARSDTQ
ncbi:MAG: hypothetical protein ACFFCK_03645, partial [Promethearchaeota archaeon]